MADESNKGKHGEVSERNPLDALLFFHKSIRVALDALDALAAVARIGTVETHRARALYDFFVGPMRWHDLDERHCLIAPLLDSQHGGQAVAILNAARKEHDDIAGIVAGLIVHLDEIARAKTLPDAALLAAAAGQLRAVMVPHLRREETELFPLARAVFDERDLAHMRDAMAERRKERDRGAHVGR